MTEHPTDALKSCPHGNRAHVLNIGGEKPYSVVVRPAYRCHQIGFYATRNEAIAAWNLAMEAARTTPIACCTHRYSVFDMQDTCMDCGEQRTTPIDERMREVLSMAEDALDQFLEITHSDKASLALAAIRATLESRP